MNVESNIDLIVNEVQKQYVHLRRTGKNRATAISIIKHNYGDALQDKEDCVAVISGLVLALCKKKELTEELAETASTMLCNVFNNQAADETTSRYLVKIESLLNDATLLGDEATYKYCVPYVPNWQIGDTFSHTIMCESAKKLGIDGWLVLFHKVGELVDDSGRQRQLMYVLLCPPSAEPADDEQFGKLKFLRIMEHDTKWDYLTQITLNSRKDELLYGFRKIGNFSNTPHPVDRTNEDPLTAMPMFGYLRKTDSYPFYEEQICRIYRTNLKHQEAAYGLDTLTQNEGR